MALEDEQGVYRLDDAPGKPHPHCYCYLTAVVPTLEELEAALANGDFDTADNKFSEDPNFNTRLDPADYPEPTLGFGLGNPTLTPTPLGDLMNGYKKTEEFVKLANPHSEQEGYLDNCTRVVTATEMRARGFDVYAGKEPMRFDIRSYEFWNVWRDQNGEIREPTSFSSSDDLMEKLLEYPPGSRFIIGSRFKGGGAHVWNAEVRENNYGEKMYRDYEAQVYTGGPVMNRSKIDPGSDKNVFLRVDDLVPDQEMLGYPDEGVEPWILPWN